MMHVVDTRPDVDVSQLEYARLLGYPRDHVFKDRARELADKARRWYAANGKPWIYARQAQQLDNTNGSICIDGVSFSSRRLQSMLRQAEANSVILVAVSAGAELECEAARLWHDEKPDEYFFLEVYGSAVVERLITMCGAQLCAWGEEKKLAVLPHYSPGYPDWDISQQPRLLDLIRRTDRQHMPGELATLDSGMLWPKKSLLAVFGLTRRMDRVRRLSELNPCEGCSFLACQFRRAPYSGTPLSPEPNLLAETKQILSNMFSSGSALDCDAKYTVNAKALARWSAERLTLTTKSDGATEALFQYEGKTCSNLGRPIRFLYRVQLGEREKGYPIREQSCGPAPGDQGHKSMCSFMDNAELLMSSINADKPLLGQRLDRVLSWDGASTGAGCYCHAGDRLHKWRLVLETIHYALAQREKRNGTEAEYSAVGQ
jgi:hypothetical protein